MQAAERLDGAGDGRGAGGGVGDVGAHEASAELVGDLLAPGVVDVGDDDVGALCRQMPGHAFADAVAAAGDQRDLAVRRPWPGS